jgi:sugar phosphate isomerase/epimerase
MKLGLLTEPYLARPLGAVLPELAELGVEAVELGTGNYPGDAHCRLDQLLDNPSAQAALIELVQQNGMTISALSQQGNPLHPRRDIAARAHDVWRQTVRLAAQLEVPVVNAFSGCPGDSDRAIFPNWVTCAWPTEYLDLLDWQWREKLVPYWTREARFAAEQGVKVGVEMHPGFVVYNPTTLLELRLRAGDSIGANFDPSHLFWQGIDPVEAIALLADEGAIFHVHAKDTELVASWIRKKGVLDTVPLRDVEHRAWSFRAVGLGHGEEVWDAIVGALVRSGYDYVISIEHEDERLETGEAVAASLALLKSILAQHHVGAAAEDDRAVRA